MSRQTEMVLSHEEQIQLYQDKQKILLDDHFDLIAPKDFYRDIFPVGSFERKGRLDDQKPNGIIIDFSHEEEENGRIVRYTVTDDLDLVDEMRNSKFAVLPPIGYYGRNRTDRNASLLFALTFDIDDVDCGGLKDMLFEMQNDVLPWPTYMINSGTGMHLYYVLNRPVPLYPSNKKVINEIRKILTPRLWNRYTSKNPEVQNQSFNQSFRIVGSCSKIGPECHIAAFRTGDKFDLHELSIFLPMTKDQKKSLNELFVKSRDRIPIEDAKKMYPDWYERKIVHQQKQAHFIFSRFMYDKYLDRIKHEIGVGHRYYAIMGLAIFAIKCGVSEEELRSDAFSLLDQFDAMSINDNNRFTRHDIESALKMYDEKYITFTADAMERVTGMSFPSQKRNYRPQSLHLQIARDTLARLNEYNDHPLQGRPRLQNKVIDWRKEHPNGSKAACVRETGLSKPTVYKWWDSAEPDEDDEFKDFDFLY